MANIKISELNELYGHQRAYDDYIPVVDSSADETKKISVGSLIPNNVNIIAVTDTAPVEYETGDKYYNTDENRIYTATSWGWENPQTPIGGILYVILADQKTYTYDGDNETLISVGGGGGGGIAVYPDEPEEDTKLYIESTDLDFASGVEIESGSNANGNWVKFSDGTLICYGIDSISTAGWKTITYPMEFISAPVITSTLYADTAETSTMAEVKIANATTTTFRIAKVYASGYLTGGITYMAIGRWM